jgi:integrase
MKTESIPGVRKDPRRNGKWQVRFRLNGQQYTKTVDTQREAVLRIEAINDRKTLVKARKIEVPPGADVGEWLFTDGREGFPVTIQERAGQSATIGELIDEYLDQRRVAVAARQLSQASYASDKYRLAAFRTFCEKKRRTALADVVSAAHLDAYRDRVFKQVGENKASAVSAKHALRTVKALILWAHEKEEVDTLPRVLNKYAEVSLPTPAPRFFTAAEIKTLYGTAAERTRLFILLALNCGYTQADIASLEHSHIDLKGGQIVRNRHKTGQPQEHKLWPRTLALLRKHVTKPGHRRPDLALMGEEGNPLVSEKIKDDGTPYKVDAIRLAFARLLSKCRTNDDDTPCEINDGRGFAIFRKTGADAIAKQYQDEPHLVDLYLAHSPKGMKVHYARQHYDKLHEATDWLATLYGFDNAEDQAAAPRAAKSSAGGKPRKRKMA